MTDPAVRPKREVDGSDFMLGLGASVFGVGVNLWIGLPAALMWIGLWCMAVGVLKAKR